jgi:hypothetical protein
MAKQHDTPRHSPVLGEFFFKDVLWDPEQPNRVFNSKNSCDWFIRHNKQALVDAQAIAVHAGRVLVHPQRFASVAQAVALRTAALRMGTTQEAPPDGLTA